MPSFLEVLRKMISNLTRKHYETKKKRKVSNTNILIVGIWESDAESGGGINYKIKKGKVKVRRLRGGMHKLTAISKVARVNVCSWENEMSSVAYSKSYPVNLFREAKGKLKVRKFFSDNNMFINARWKVYTKNA